MKTRLMIAVLVALLGMLGATANAAMLYELTFEDGALTNTGTVGGTGWACNSAGTASTNVPANGGVYSWDMTFATDMVWPAVGPGLGLPGGTTLLDMTNIAAPPSETMTIATSIYLAPSTSGNYSGINGIYYRGIANNRATNGTGGWYFGVQNNRLRFGSTGVAPKIASSLPLSEGYWYHVAVTWTAGGNMTMYVNGAAQDMGTVAPVTDSSGNNISAALLDDGQFWPLNGKIDNFQIYNTILSASEIAALAPPRSNPVAFTWNAAAGNGDWDTSTNWNPNGIPGDSAGDSVRFQDLWGTPIAQYGTFNVTLSSAKTIAGVTVDSGNFNYNLFGTGTLNISGDFFHKRAWGTNYIQPVLNITGLYRTDPSIIDTRTIIKFGNATSYTNGNIFAGGIANYSETMDIGGTGNTFGGSITVQGYTTVPWTTNMGVLKISGTGNTYGAIPLNLNAGGTFRPTNQDLSTLSAINFNGGVLRLDGGGNTFAALANGFEVKRGGIFIGSNADLGGNFIALGDTYSFGYLRGAASDVTSEIKLVGNGGVVYGSADGAINADFGVSGLVSGSGMLIKNGEKTLTFSGAIPNTYTGGTVVAGGILNVGAGSTLGTGSVSVVPRASLGMNAAANVDSAASVLLQGAPGTFGYLRMKADVAFPAIDANSTGTIMLEAGNSNSITSIGSAFLGTANNRTYSGASLAVGTGNTYRLGGSMGPLAGDEWNCMIAIANAVLTGDNNLLVSYGGAWLNAPNTYTGATTLNHMIAPWGARDIWLQVGTWWGTNGTMGTTTGAVNMMGGQMRASAQWGENTITKGALSISSSNIIGASHYWAANSMNLTFASLTRLDRGSVELWNPEVEDFGVANGSGKTVTISITATPAVNNGIVAPWITIERGLNGVNNFATYGGAGAGTFSTAVYSQTVPAGAFPTGLSAGTDVVATTGDVTLGDNPVIYALRANGAVTAGAGNTVTLGSGGLIFNAAATSNANFKAGADGTGELILYTNYNTTLSGQITANGLTKNGTAGSLILTGTNPGLTGKVTVNGGYITATDASLGSANIVLNGGGLLVAGGMTKTVYIGPAGGAQMYSATWPMAPLADETPGQSGPFVIYAFTQTNKNNDAFTGGMIMYAQSLRLDGNATPGMGPVVIYPGYNLTTYGYGWNNASRWTLMAGNSYNNNTSVVISSEISGAQTFKFGSIVGSGNISFGQYTYNNPTTGSGISVGADNTDADYYGTIYEVNPGYAGSVTKTGTGIWTLWADNAWHGTTTINGGTLRINGGLYNVSAAVGAAVIVNATGTLDGTGTVERSVTVNNGGQLNGGLHITGGVNIFGATATASLTNAKIDNYFGIYGSTVAVTNSIVNGSFALGSGSYTGTSTISGNLSIYNGTFNGTHTINANAGAPWTGGPAGLQVAGGTLDGNNTITGDVYTDRDENWNGYAGTIQGSGTITGNVHVWTGSYNGTHTITGNVDVQDYWFFDVLESFNSNFAGAANISGNVTLGTNNGSTGTVTFGGNHTIGGNLAVAAGNTQPIIIAPGNSAGIITVGGDLTVDANTTFNYELGAPGSLGTSDLIDITGNLTLDGTLNVAALEGFNEGTYRLFNYALGGLSDLGLTLGTTPGMGFNYEISTATDGQIDLLVSTPWDLYDTNHDTFKDSLDIDAIFQNFTPIIGSYQWDVDQDGDVDKDDVTAELNLGFLTNYADANLDTKVDLVDFQALLDNWQNSGGWDKGDFTGDGLVEFEDFQVLLDYWNPSGIWNFSQVPEPTTMVLLALGGLALLRRNRRA